MRSRLLLPALLALVGAQPAVAQDRPATTIVALAARVADDLARDYSPTQEKVWCVTAWDSTAHDDYTLITVTAVAYVGTGEPNKIANSTIARTASCPIIHAHSPGNCQASPADRETAVARGARFDGILCGDRATTWYYGEEIAAAANYKFLLSLQHN